MTSDDGYEKPATEFARLVTENRIRSARLDGFQTGAMAVLAPALGVEPQIGAPTHQLMGRRFRVSIEWLDPIGEDHLATVRHMAEQAQARVAQGDF